ncbi:MAG: hypothetical protein KDB07_09710, partial [Planctomycetes bacterium]|nr:hypothetical protein [Planctomycetota bacterium]
MLAQEGISQVRMLVAVSLGAIMLASGLQAQVFAGLSRGEIETWVRESRAKESAEEKRRREIEEANRLAAEREAKRAAAIERAKREAAERETRLQERGKELEAIIKSAPKRGKTLFQAFEKQYLKSAKRNYGEDVYGVLEMRVKFACGQITNPRE